MTDHRTGRARPAPSRKERGAMDVSIFATVGFTVAATAGILVILATSRRRKP